MGIDIGGTFTDFVAVNEETGAISTWKRLSTPSDPSIAFFDGLDELLSTMKSPASAIRRILHGTTIASNALIERRGAKTAYLTTEGFKDVIHMGTEGRYAMYDLNFKFADPFGAAPFVRGGERENRFQRTRSENDPIKGRRAVYFESAEDYQKC